MEYTEAEALVRRAIELEPSNGENHWMLADCYCINSQWAEALTECRESIRLKHPAELKAISCLRQLGRLDEAMEMLDGLRTRWPSRIDVQIERARLMIASNRRDEAVEILIQLAPELLQADGDVNKSFGEVALELGENELARTACTRAFPLLTHPVAVYNVGVQLYRIGSVERAEEAFGRAATLAPYYAEVHCNRGLCLEEMNRLEESEIEYRLALKANPELVEAHVNLGSMLHTLKRFDEGVDLLRRGVALDPSNFNMQFNLAQSLREQGKHDESLAAFQSASILNPESPLAFAECGRLNLSLGRYAVATAAFKRALELGTQEPTCRFDAARSAVLTANTAESLQNREVRLLQANAIDWLRSDLNALVQDLPMPELLRRLDEWLEDSELASVRDVEALAAFPPNERAEWTQFWPRSEPCWPTRNSLWPKTDIACLAACSRVCMIGLMQLSTDSASPLRCAAVRSDNAPDSSVRASISRKRKSLREEISCVRCRKWVVSSIQRNSGQNCRQRLAGW
jgi:tetratricopeptide (TPR) repeat protein